MVEHNHKDHRCCTKDKYGMEPFIPTPQLGTVEGQKAHTCCCLGCDKCEGACSVW